MATFTVTNLFDSGTGSFRQAISDANTTAGTDDILFNAGLSGGTINLTSGELLISDDLTINGLGADLLTVDAGELSRVFKIDDQVIENFINVSIDGLTITGGIAPIISSSNPFGSSSGFQNSGAGIFSQENLVVTNSIISNNMGDGITMINLFPEVVFGSVNGKISNTIISDNSGNGIVSKGSDLEVTQSAINDNSGSGIFNEFSTYALSAYGNTILTDSQVSDNQGSGIVNKGNMEVRNSTIYGNSSSGIFNESLGQIRSGLITGNLEVQNSIITGNKTDGNGGGIFTGYGKVEVTNSTIVQNEAVGNGGGIYISPRFQYSQVDITNSTISNNVALGRGGGIYMGYRSDFTEVINSTISGNVALDSGGGIVQVPYSYFPFPSIKNTIIAGNNGTNPDIEGDFRSNGFNLIGNLTGGTGFENDMIEPDITKILDTTLADNGGSTLTHALVSGSPAIDAGNNNDVPVGITTDQRGMGFNRIVDGNNDTIAIVDIGAFEVQPSTSVPEPSSILGLVGLVIIGTGSLLRRKLQNKL